MTDKRRKEIGSVEVEATFILPIAILSVVMLLYLSLFMFQKANLQGALETSLLYFKNLTTDRFLTKNDEITYSSGEDTRIGTGNSYDAQAATNRMFEKLFQGQKKPTKDEFEKYFYSVAGNMLFSEELNVDIFVDYGILESIYEAMAEQTVHFPLDFSMIGVDRDLVFTASARISVVNNDAIINDTDFVIDILEDTRLGEFAREFGDKVSEIYGKIREKLLK